ncbi:MAG TPA: glycosyltransferase [Streptosporangiaceae bacterium]|nr:glycosyltransferase [Streptosporangiaceae bacterium]
MIVVHDGARLLPGLINAVREQTHPVERVVGVDTGSRDRSGAALTELLGPDAVFGMEADTGYGTAVSRALQRPAARMPVRRSGAGQETAVEWIWLLHDDCEPAADALEQLLRGASRGRSTAVLGPKLRDLHDRRVLREAGVAPDRAGRRFTGIEPGEIDQGQHDGNRPVLAVSSAGMLIRRDVWDQVGGFDANLPLFRDDIDFCWRVRAAGYEVRVITDAVVYHREMSARQSRRAPAAGGRPRLADRRGALYVFAVNLPLWPMIPILGGCVAGSLLRAAYYLITKQQHKAWDHLGAIAWLLRHPIRLWRARRRRAPHRKYGWSIVRGQLPRGRTLARLAESAAGLLSSGPGYDSGGVHHAVTDEPGDDIPLPDPDSVVRRILSSPGVLLFLGLALVALVAERSLVGSVFSGSATLAGGALVPAWGGSGDLWREYLAGYHTAGLGSTVSAPPYLGVVAALATLLLGKPWLAVDVLLLGCVPAAGMAAYWAMRRVTHVLAARIWAAVTYALLPVAMGGVAAGRLGTAVVFVLVPLIGITVGRMLTRPPRLARRAAWAAGLLVAVAAAFVPLAWPVAVVAALGAVAAWRWLGRAKVISAAIVALVPAAVLLPWSYHLLASPSRFFLEAGIQRPGLASAGLRPESVLLLSPGGPGLPPVWVTAGLVLTALGALLVRRRMALVQTGWGIALGGLAIALAESMVRVTAPGGGIQVSAWPGLALIIAAAGLLVAATPLVELAVQAFPRARNAVADRLTDIGWHRLPVLASLVVAASAPVLAAGCWLATGIRGPIAAAAPQILPAFVAASSSGPDQVRTLVLRQEGGIMTYTVLRNTDPVLGEPELTQAASATQALDGVVASLDAAASGDEGNTGQALSQFDIDYVMLPAPVDQSLVHQIDGAGGLMPLTQSSAYDLWQVAGAVARARVVGADGSVVPVPSGAIGVNTVIAPGTSGTLVLAEAAGGWSATLNGRPLTHLADPAGGWAQGFVLPSGGGRLVVSRNETARDVSLGFEAAAVLVVFALALPGTRSAVPAPAEEPSPDVAEAPAPGRRRDRARGARLPRRKRLPQPALAIGRARGASAAEDRPADLPVAAVPDPYAYAGDVEYAPAYDSGPVLSVMPGGGADLPPRSENGASAGTFADSTPVRPEPGLPKRARGGQHAARHGKPSRWRGGGTAKPAPSHPALTQSPVITDPDEAEVSPDRPLEDFEFLGGDGDGGGPAWLEDSSSASQRPPWELGDQP